MAMDKTSYITKTERWTYKSKGNWDVTDLRTGKYIKTHWGILPEGAMRDTSVPASSFIKSALNPK